MVLYWSRFSSEAESIECIHKESVSLEGTGLHDYEEAGKPKSSGEASRQRPRRVAILVVIQKPVGWRLRRAKNSDEAQRQTAEKFLLFGETGLFALFQPLTDRMRHNWRANLFTQSSPI